jgi:multimeric flavodoxin WrbA
LKLKVLHEKQYPLAVFNLSRSPCHIFNLFLSLTGVIASIKHFIRLKLNATGGEENMVKVLILYYSRSGNVEALAKAVSEGVKKVEDATVELKRVDYATVDDLLSCDAVAFGSPNYFGYMAGLLKDFFDRAWSVREKISGKPAVAFTCGGSSSNSALLSIERIFPAFKMEKAAEGVAWGLREKGSPFEKNLSELKRLGETLAKTAVERKIKVPED